MVGLDEKVISERDKEVNPVTIPRRVFQAENNFAYKVEQREQVGE